MKTLTMLLMLCCSVCIGGEPEIWFAPPVQATEADKAAQWRTWTSRCGEYTIYGKLVNQTSLKFEIQTCNGCVEVHRRSVSSADLAFLREYKYLFPDVVSEQRKIKVADIARQIQEMDIEEAEFEQLKQQRCIITKRGRVS